MYNTIPLVRRVIPAKEYSAAKSTTATENKNTRDILKNDVKSGGYFNMQHSACDMHTDALETVHIYT